MKSVSNSMDAAEKFADKMRDRSDFELYKITTTLRDNYQPAAVMAAEHELKSRNLSTEDINAANAMLEAESRELERKKQKRWFKRRASDPVYSTVRVIVTSIGIVFLVHFFAQWDLLVSVLKSLGQSDFSVFTFMMPFVLVPVALYGLLQFQKYGWLTLSFLLGFYGIEGFVQMLYEIQYQGESVFFQFQMARNRMMVIDSYTWLMFSQLTSVFQGIPKMVGSAIFLVYLNRAAMLERFEISKRSQIGILAFVVIVSLITILFVFNPI